MDWNKAASGKENGTHFGVFPNMRSRFGHRVRGDHLVHDGPESANMRAGERIEQSLLRDGMRIGAIRSHFWVRAERNGNILEKGYMQGTYTGDMKGGNVQMEF